MTHGWNTTKTEAGYRWQVSRFEYGAGATILQSGVCTTRAKAMGRAKAWALYYRRGGK